jgi:hypothetical protein
VKNADDGLDGEAGRIVAEIQASIRDRFPRAVFNVRVGPDRRVYLAAYTDATQDFEVHDLVAERTVDALIAGKVTVHVFPRRLPPPDPEATGPSPR